MGIRWFVPVMIGLVKENQLKEKKMKKVLVVISIIMILIVMTTGNALSQRAWCSSERSPGGGCKGQCWCEGDEGETVQPCMFYCKRGGSGSGTCGFDNDCLPEST